MIALLGALQNEISGIEKAIRVERRVAGKPWQVIQGSFASQEILLVRTGMGKQCALKTTAHVFENYPVSAVISFGFAGALAVERKVGDVALCRNLYHESAAESYASDARLLTLAEQALRGGVLRLFTADCLTVDALTANSPDRRIHGEASAAQVVEMESYWVASLAAARALPFLGVRAISDEVGENLPPFDRFMNSDGEWQVRDALRYFLVHPGDWLKLPGIYRRSQKALRSLTASLTALIPEVDGGA